MSYHNRPNSFCPKDRKTISLCDSNPVTSVMASHSFFSRESEKSWNSVDLRMDFPTRIYFLKCLTLYGYITPRLYVSAVLKCRILSVSRRWILPGATIFFERKHRNQYHRKTKQLLQPFVSKERARRKKKILLARFQHTPAQDSNKLCMY